MDVGPPPGRHPAGPGEQPIFEGWLALGALAVADVDGPARPDGQRQHVPQPRPCGEARHDPRPRQRRAGRSSASARRTRSASTTPSASTSVDSPGERLDRLGRVGRAHPPPARRRARDEPTGPSTDCTTRWHRAARRSRRTCRSSSAAAARGRRCATVARSRGRLEHVRARSRSSGLREASPARALLQPSAAIPRRSSGAVSFLGRRARRSDGGRGGAPTARLVDPTGSPETAGGPIRCWTRPRASPTRLRPYVATGFGTIVVRLPRAVRPRDHRADRRGPGGPCRLSRPRRSPWT